MIGTAGGLTQEKGTDDLLQAAATLCTEHPDLTVCVVGEGPLWLRLRRRRRRLESWTASC